MAGNSSVVGLETITFTDNMSFDGTQRGGAMNTDGQLWIGSTIARHVKLGSITSPLGTIAVGYSSPNITLDIVSGGVAVEHLTGNTGGQLNPTANNFNTLGTGNITIAGSGSTLTTQLTGLTNHALQVGAGTATLTQLANGTTGQFLTANTGADPSWTTQTAFTSVVTQVFTSNGTYTPTANMKYCIAYLVGGGGGGAGAATTGASQVAIGAGGGGGGGAIKVISAATIGASQTVTIGSGGAGGVGNAAGSGGTATSLGAIVSASQGTGGGNAAAGVNVSIGGGAGGVGTGGDINFTGAGGGAAYASFVIQAAFMAGYGGSSFFGGGVESQAGSGSTGSNGNAGHIYGGGGAGAENGDNQASTRTGGAGAAGVMYIIEYI